MKLVLIGNFGISYGQVCDERHIADALKSIGHQVTEIQREQFASQISEHENLTVDATIFFKWQGYNPEDITRWKKITNAPALAWTFDFMPQHDYFYPVLERVDLWLGEEAGLLPEWERRGFKFHYFPNHAVPPNFFPRLDLPKEYDVSFTGTHIARGGRVDLLTEVNKHFDLHVFGNGYEGWAMDVKNAHPPAFDQKLSEVVAKSKIMLGINVFNECPGYWSIRPVQVLMAGGFMLQKYVPGMEKELRDGAAYFTSTEDCIEKIRYYLDHEEERNRIAERGYWIAQANLTAENRARELTVLLENYPWQK